MPPNNNNDFEAEGWWGYRKLVLAALEELKEDVKELGLKMERRDEKVHIIEEKIANMQGKAIALGSLAGFIVSIIGIVVNILLK